MVHFVSHADQERRLIRRHEIKTPLRIRLCKPDGPEQKAESLNLSEYGVCFATDSLLHEGQTVEVALRMPEEVSGEESDERRCTGRVVREACRRDIVPPGERRENLRVQELPVRLR